jgi:hypothetical protein
MSVRTKSSQASEYSGKPNNSKALLVLEDAGVYKSMRESV